MTQAAQPSTVVDVVVINIVIVINIVVLIVTMVVIVTATLVVGVVVIMVANRIRFRFRIVPIRRAVHRSCIPTASPVLLRAPRNRAGCFSCPALSSQPSFALEDDEENRGEDDDDQR
jgi:hypothetical protein